MSRGPRRWLALTIGLTLALILLCIGALLAARNLNDAAAWANVIALFVAILGTGISMFGLRHEPDERRAPRKRSPSVVTAKIRQTNRASGNAVNLIGNDNSLNIDRRDR